MLFKKLLATAEMLQFELLFFYVRQFSLWVDETFPSEALKLIS